MASDDSKSFARRDRLLKIQEQAQCWWDENNVFQATAGDQPPKPVPFPYMNGFLHLGHAFSLSKLKFAAAYDRLRGANEIALFGNPPVFNKLVEEIQDVATKPDESNDVAPPEKFKSTKSKAAAKLGVQVYHSKNNPLKTSKS